MVIDGCEKTPRRTRSGNYPNCGNAFLPSNFNVGLRHGPGFLFRPSRLIALFCGFSPGPTVATSPARRSGGGVAMEPRRYTFRSNMLQGRIAKPETRA
jgi:hypothetical protein